jgi:hypothetical protein
MDEEAEEIDLKQYYEAFRGAVDLPSDARVLEAYRLAVATREFEIKLYWQRATYFWAFIAVALAMYGAVQQVRDEQTRFHLSVIAACLGLLFSFAWFLVNKGSKHWQENWENHIALLEDDISGPIFGIKVQRLQETSPLKTVKRWIVGPARFSVSRINQVVSLFVTLLWLLLLLRTLAGPESWLSGWSVFLVVILTIVAGALTHILAQSDDRSHELKATRSRSTIKPDDDPKEAQEMSEVGQDNRQARQSSPVRMFMQLIQGVVVGVLITTLAFWWNNRETQDLSMTVVGFTQKKADMPTDTAIEFCFSNSGNRPVALTSMSLSVEGVPKEVMPYSVPWTRDEALLLEPHSVRVETIFFHGLHEQLVPRQGAEAPPTVFLSCNSIDSHGRLHSARTQLGKAYVDRKLPL